MSRSTGSGQSAELSAACGVRVNEDDALGDAGDVAGVSVEGPDTIGRVNSA